MKKSLAIGLAAAGLLAGATSVDAAHGVGDLTVGLNGANEVGTDGDPDGSGKIDLAFFGRRGPEQPAYVCFDLTTRNVETITALHIHVVDAGASNPRTATGGVAVNLLGGTPVDEGDDCVVVDDAVLEGMVADPSDYYVNAHNADFPAGAVRGQLHGFS